MEKTRTDWLNSRRACTDLYRYIRLCTRQSYFDFGPITSRLGRRVCLLDKATRCVEISLFFLSLSLIFSLNSLGAFSLSIWLYLTTVADFSQHPRDQAMCTCGDPEKRIRPLFDLSLFLYTTSLLAWRRSIWCFCASRAREISTDSYVDYLADILRQSQKRGELTVRRTHTPNLLSGNKSIFFLSFSLSPFSCPRSHFSFFFFLLLFLNRKKAPRSECSTMLFHLKTSRSARSLVLESSLFVASTCNTLK